MATASATAGLTTEGLGWERKETEDEEDHEEDEEDHEEEEEEGDERGVRKAVATAVVTAAAAAAGIGGGGVNRNSRRWRTIDKLSRALGSTRRRGSFQAGAAGGEGGAGEPQQVLAYVCVLVSTIFCFLRQRVCVCVSDPGCCAKI